ncbi:hypothetical protein PVA38_12400 [Streptococcus pneumoniae D39]|nr:hypothetical protein PVA38_12400 [Streptococcus pneumoniae D39]
MAPVSYTHLRAHETVLDLVCRLLLEKKKHTQSPQSPPASLTSSVMLFVITKILVLVDYCYLGLFFFYCHSDHRNLHF